LAANIKQNEKIINLKGGCDCGSGEVLERLKTGCINLHHTANCTSVP
jgi:hypothetical protein